MLSWLNPVDANFGPASRRESTSLCPVSSTSARYARGHGSRAPRPGASALDVGIARDGADPAEWPGLCRAAFRGERRGQLHVAGLMGHLGCADRPTRCTRRAGHASAGACGRLAKSRPAPRRYATWQRRRRPYRSARVHGPVPHRAGLVGIDPSRTTRLHPALTLPAPVVAVRRGAGSSIFGLRAFLRATRADTTVGLLAVGYADGLPRAAPPAGPRSWCAGTGAMLPG